MNEASPYLRPTAECDLVMKGGITSGIVYPPAVLELAKKYRLRSIGGTSAGAIAAVVVAAAEFGRESGGFERLGEMSTWLGRNTNLFDRFQPSPRARPLFDALLSLNSAAARTRRHRDSGRPSWLQFLRAAAILGGAVFWMCTILAAALGVTFVLLPWWLRHHAPAPPAVLLAVVLALVFAVLGAVTAVVIRLRTLFGDIRDNMFGICSGRTQVGGNGLGLADWLHVEINKIAGAPFGPDAEPLTLGHIEAKQVRERPLGPDGKPLPEITLQTVTTNLSNTTSCVLPFDSNIYIFKDDDLRQLFPEAVVQFMGGHAHTSQHITLPDGFHFMPEPSDLPLIVLARMSLSFPVLLSAVPLYVVSAAGYRNKDAAGHVTIGNPATELHKLWFSDGGISSNFPIHFFDRWLPSRPTFGINLADLPKSNFEGTSRSHVRADKRSTNGEDSVSTEAVFLPVPNRTLPPEWIEIGGLGAFLNAAWSTAQNYRDNKQAQLAGSRDRIVQVRFASDEGGLNLAMGPDAIKSIVGKGRKAGELLVSDFCFDNHRWIRMRVLLNELERELIALTASDKVARIEDMLAGKSYPPPSDAWMEQAKSRLIRLLEGFSKIQGEGKVPFDPHPPKPEGVLRITPP